MYYLDGQVISFHALSGKRVPANETASTAIVKRTAEFAAGFNPFPEK
jgi:hypothetical protein